MQRRWDAGYCLTRGLEKVRTAFSWTVRAYHLRRVWNLVEIPRLRAARGGDVRGRSVVGRATAPEEGLGSVPVQASGCRK